MRILAGVMRTARVGAPARTLVARAAAGSAAQRAGTVAATPVPARVIPAPPPAAAAAVFGGSDGVAPSRCAARAVGAVVPVGHQRRRLGRVRTCPLTPLVLNREAGADSPRDQHGRHPGFQSSA